jgi:hypothetical protein
LSREWSRRLSSSTPAAPSAATSRDHGVATKTTSSAPATANPFAVCHASKGAISESSSSAPAAALLPRDDPPHHDEPEHGRQRGVAEIAVERQCEQERNGIETASRAGVDPHRRHRETHDVVGEDSGEQSRHGDQQGEQRGWRDVGSSECTRDARIEAAEPQLCGYDHQAEEQRERRHVDGRTGLRERHRATREQCDRAEERDTGAIERQARQLAEDHAGVDHREDHEHERIHAHSPLPAIRARPVASMLRSRCRALALATHARCALLPRATRNIARTNLHPAFEPADTRSVCWGLRGGGP